MSDLVPMITREMLKYDPINHTIWFEDVAPEPAKRTLARLAAAALATKIAVLAVARAS